jgi:metal-responsive CopG/Arc/MetJ family transcriptional regulator
MNGNGMTLKHSKQITVFLKHDLIKRIEDFQHNNRFMNRNKAIIDLIEKGLATLKKDKKKNTE